MTKIIRIENCSECRLSSDEFINMFESVERVPLYCSALDLSPWMCKVPKEGIHPDCPLSDESEQIKEVAVEFRIQPIIHEINFRKDWYDQLIENTNKEFDKFMETRRGK